MNRKLLGASLATVFAISMIGFAAAGGHPSWLGFDNTTQDADKKNKTTVLSFVSADVVPRSPTQLVGFAWFYDDTTNPAPEHTAFGITSHDAPLLLDDDSYNEVRDSTQNPNNWHPHNVILDAGAGDATFCIKDLSDAPNAGISFDEDTLLTKVNVRNSVLTGEFPDTPTVAAFSIITEALCPETIGTELVGDANTNPHAGVGLGIIVHQVE